MHETGDSVGFPYRAAQIGVVSVKPDACDPRPHLQYEPDLCFIRKQREFIVKEKFIDGPPDLIIEVISESNRTHDTVVKFQNYAQHGVAEYWLVDPRDNEISTWRQNGDQYLLLGRASPGGCVLTEVLNGLELDSGRVLDDR
jgi:Uma2 family endonuclease